MLLDGAEAFHIGDRVDGARLPQMQSRNWNDIVCRDCLTRANTSLDIVTRPSLFSVAAASPIPSVQQFLSSGGDHTHELISPTFGLLVRCGRPRDLLHAEGRFISGSQPGKCTFSVDIVPIRFPYLLNEAGLLR